MQLDTHQHLMSLEEEHVLQLTLGQLMLFMELPLLHFPNGGLSSPHELLLLLEELAVQERDLLLVGVAQTSQRGLVRVV